MIFSRLAFLRVAVCAHPVAPPFFCRGRFSMLARSPAARFPSQSTACRAIRRGERACPVRAAFYPICNPATASRGATKSARNVVVYQKSIRTREAGNLESNGAENLSRGDCGFGPGAV